MAGAELTRLLICSKPTKRTPSLASLDMISLAELASYTPDGCVDRAIQWTQRIREFKVNGESLLEALRYDGTSFWWFGHTLLYSSVKEAVFRIEQTKRLLEERPPEDVTLVGLGGIGEVVRQVCETNDVKCRWKHTLGERETQRLIDQIKILTGKMLLRRKWTRRKRIRNKPPLLGDSTNRPVLFLSPSVNWRSVWNFETGSEERRDVFMGRVMREVRKQGFDPICVDVDYNLRGRTGALNEKLQSNEWRWVPFESYSNHEVFEKANANPDFDKLKGIFCAISHSKTFRESLRYQRVFLWDYLESRFRRLMSSIYLLEYARILETARLMMRAENPVAVVMTYETGAYARAAIVAAKEFGVPSVAVQHGLISPESAEYIHLELSPNESDWSCPIPTKTAVGGVYTADLLTKQSSYSVDAVAVTGYTKHDDLVDLMKHEAALDRVKLLSGLGLNPSTKTVIVASGGFHAKYGWVHEYDRELLESILALAAKRGDLQMIVRLHPIEDGRMQAEAFRACSEVKGAIVKGERNDLVWASDVFVTINSSTALDALVLGKPVFLLNQPTRDVPGVDLGNAVQICRLQELGEQISMILDDSSFASKRLAAQRSQMERYLNTVDGLASARVATLVQQLISDSGQNRH